MPALHEPRIHNHLLNRLPEEELNALREVLEYVELPHGYVMAGPDKVIEYVYFLSEGIGSVLTVMGESQRVEAGMFGVEGFSPTSAAVGGTISVHEIFMLIEGSGWRVGLEDFSRVVAANPAFADLLVKYNQTFISQVSYTALASVALQMHERVARWLLMCHDRMGGNEITLTHDAISHVLGVRRPSITTALHILEGKRLIRAERGRITIRDRGAIEAMVGETYGKPEAEYRRLLGEL
ncbi:Crp/Fnr family transcriptional regulator [Rhizobium sp. L1K21]|uniref:Crp/Fnr family transcriptional regulator n=1 Tax=Rhizobium sp. L1K21 TaxID=2954933 RepID=UPI0020924D9D|nr:Crp/Fnr family transcriptional regulator [Rhizobium sp. L1K21]MCO6187847.1 Crp/Fnr family transcriptional regulator [Rhizobium sp. L1K21]